MTTPEIEHSRQRLFVVGMGGAGGQLGVSFQNPPAWLAKPVGATEAVLNPYPVEVAVFDTNEQAKSNLSRPEFGFVGEPYIISGLTRDQIIQFFTRQLGSTSDGTSLATPAGLAKERIHAGAGRHPLLAREMAVRSLAESGEVIAANLRSTYLFRKGAMVTTHAVNGGTGSGISPIMMDFLSRRFFEEHPGLALDIAILPEMRDIEGAAGFYPANAIVSLNQILRERSIPDAVILVDNDQIRTMFGAKNRPAINAVIRNAILPLLLCSEASYSWPYFGDQPDLSNIRSFVRPGKGFGLATFCTLGFAKSGGPSRLKGLKSFFRDLVATAFRQTMIDLAGGNPASDEIERPDSVVAVFVASPDFYQKRLGNDSSSVEDLVDAIVSNVGVTNDRRCLIHYVAVPGLSDVMLSLLISGVESTKLKLMWSMAHGRPPDPRERIVTSIRKLSPAHVEGLAFGEIREHIQELTE